MVEMSRRIGAKWGRNEAVVVLAIIAAMILVWPVGDYAILDDWCFVKPLEYLHYDGQLVILDWVPMSTVGHLFWGVLFTKLFGFSFTVTKVSVIVLCLIESVVMLRLLALCGIGRNLSLGAVLALVFNPLHFLHATLFMSDVPSMTWQVISVFCYLKGLLAVDANGDGSASGSIRQGLLWLLVGSAAAAEAYLIRQNGITVPLAVILYLAVFARRLFRPRILFATLAPAVFVIGNFTYWYHYVHGPTSYFQNRSHQLAEFITHPPLADLPFIIFSIAAYAGWFLIPLALAMPLRTFRWPSPTRNVIFLGVAILALNAFAYFTFEAGKVFPYIWNVITPCGLFFSGEFVIDRRDLLWGHSVGLVLGAACLMGTLALLQRLICRQSWQIEPERVDSPGGIGQSPPLGSGPAVGEADRAANVAGRLLSVLLALQLAYAFATAPILFDRHLLLFAPTVIVLFCVACREIQSVNWARYVACFVPLAFYSITTTHDVHALSRAAYQAGTDLVNEGIDPRSIDAGYAFNGWSTYERHHETISIDTTSTAWWRADVWRDRFNDPPDRGKWSIGWPPRTWWFRGVSAGIETKYAVTCPAPSIGSVPRFQIVRQYPYRNWWPWKVNTVCVLKGTD
jgi:hypothetical protein